MTVQQVIEEIEKLSEAERVEVEKYLAESKAGKYPDETSFDEAADKMFQKHSALFQKLAS